MCNKINTNMSTRNTMVLNHSQYHWHKTHFIGSHQEKKKHKGNFEGDNWGKAILNEHKIPYLKPDYMESWYNFF